MRRQYRERYNIDTTTSMWANLRKRWGYDLRMQRDNDLIPWAVRPEHRYAYPLKMLRAEGRRRRGERLNEQDGRKLPAFLETLREVREDRPLGSVVDYLPDLFPEEGFVLVARKPTDDDIIRRPDHRTGMKWESPDDG